MTDRPSRGLVRRVLRERRWTIVFVTLMFAGVAALFDLRSPVTWAPYAEVEIGTLSPNTPFLGIRTLKADVPPEVAAGRAAQTVSEPEVLLDARRRLAGTVPAGYSLSGRARAYPGRAPGRVLLVVRDSDRDRGVAAANAFAQSVVARIEKLELERLDGIIATFRRQRRTLVAEGRPGTRSHFRERVIRFFSRKDFDHQVAALETLRRIAQPARVARAALPPEHPEFKPGKRTWPAIFMGFNIGLIAAFVLDAFARRSRDPHTLVRAAGLPLLGQVPKLGRRRAAATRLAYEHLRVAVTGMGRGGAARVVLVTSADPGAGKSTVALGVARAAASAGRRACLVECDLRRPTLALRLGLEGPGLGETIAGRATKDETVVEAPGLDGALPLSLVHAGAPTRRPGQALASDTFRELLGSLADSYDLVVLDAPPILVGSDALELAAEADAVLLCGRLGRTPVDELESARAALDRLPPVPAGFVLTGVPTKNPALAWREGTAYAPSPGTV